MFVDLFVIKEQAQPLLAHVDSCAEVFVDSLRRHEELLSKDVQQSIAANEADEVISAFFWFWQRVCGRFLAGWES